MATLGLTTAQIELANSLAVDDIPVKFRCATCNRLALEAVKTPCCAQSLCQSCQSLLAGKCLVCEHNPLKLDDCTPNKPLRATVKAFLKSQERKRESAAAALATPAVEPETTLTTTIGDLQLSSERATSGTDLPATTNVPSDVGIEIDSTAQELTEENEGADEQGANTNAEHDDATVLETVEAEADTATEAQQPELADGSEPTHADGQPEGQNEMGDDTEEGGNATWAGKNNANGGPTANGGFGFNQGQPGFGMDWNNAMLNPMMQMQMQNAGWGGGFPNMMSAPGMGMTPFDFNSGMYNGFGNGMQGMNGMNMGMGFDAGYGNWGAQQMNGGFGANAGYFPQGGAFNQQGGNFQQMNHQQQQYARNNFQNRYDGQNVPNRGGFGRGRGNFSQDVGRRTSISRPTSRQSSNAGLSTAALRQPSNDGSKPEEAASPAVSRTAADNPQSENADDNQQQKTNGETPSPEDEEGKTSHDFDQSAQQVSNDSGNVQQDYTGQFAAHAAFEGNGTYPNDMSMMNQAHQMMDPIYGMGYDQGYGQYQYNNHQMNEFGYRGRGRGGFGRGGFRGRGGYQNQYNAYGHGAYGAGQADQQEPIGQGVEGAPTGPKAWREGQQSSRGRGGFQAQGRGPGQYMNGSADTPETTVNVKGQQDASGPITLYDSDNDGSVTKDDAERSRSGSRSGSRQPSMRPSTQSPARLRSPSQSQHHHQSRRSHSPRSEPSIREPERRKHKSNGDRDDRFSHGEDPTSRDYSDEEPHKRRSKREDEREDKYASSRSHRRHKRDRSRSPARDHSDDEHANGHHHESRDREKDRHRRRDDDRRRTRDRDDDKYAKERDRERDRDREKDRDKDRKRSRRHRSRTPESDSDREHRRQRRKDRDRERDRKRDRHDDDRRRESRKEYDDDYRYDENGSIRRSAKSTRETSPTREPLSASTTAHEPEEEFKIQGRARDRHAKPPPSGPASMQTTLKAPPTGPKAQRPQIQINLLPRDPPKGPAAMGPPTGPRKSTSAAALSPISATRDHTPLHSRTSSRDLSSRVEKRDTAPPTPSSAAVTPTTPVDPYQQEREARQRERMLKEQERRRGSDASFSRKRSLAEAGDGDEGFAPPTGPRGDSGAGGRKSKARRVSQDDRGAEKGRKGERWR